MKSKTVKIANLRKGVLTLGTPVPRLALAAVMSFLKETKGLLTWTTMDLANTLNITKVEANSVLAILRLQDYVRPTRVEGEWITSPAGESVAGATSPRFRLASVNSALTKLSGRIRTFNRDSAGFRIKRAVAFLSGQVKSGQRWSGQNRPTDVARDLDVVLCRSLSGQV